MNRMFPIDRRANSERRASARLWFRGLGTQARTCGSTSLRGTRSASPVCRRHSLAEWRLLIRFVISTASSSAAVASKPETFGCTPVARAFDKGKDLALERFLFFDLNLGALDSAADLAINFAGLVLIIEREIGVLLEDTNLAHPLRD